MSQLLLLGVKALLFCFISLFLFPPVPDGISASIVTGTFVFAGRWHLILKVSGWSTLSIILIMIGLLFGCYMQGAILITQERGEVSGLCDACDD